MMNILILLPLSVILILSPHHVTPSQIPELVQEGPSAYVEIPNMHQIGAPVSQFNKPNFEAEPPGGAHAPQADDPKPSTKTPSKDTSPLIKQACENTPAKQLCIDSLKAERLSANADMKSLTFISLNITKNKANRITEWLYDQLDDKTLEVGVQQAFTDCAEQYTDAVAQVEDSILAFFANAFNDINLWMNTAVANADVCEKALKDNNCLPSMGNRNQEFKQHCKNCLAIASRLMNQH